MTRILAITLQALDIRKTYDRTQCIHGRKGCGNLTRPDSNGTIRCGECTNHIRNNMNTTGRLHTQVP